MVQTETSGKTCFDIGEVQPIDAERAGWGEYDSLNELQFSYYHTPQSLRDCSPILGEQLKHSKLFSSNSR